MLESEIKFTPTVTTQQSLKVQVPNTAEGREFLEDLKRLLKVEKLPFRQSCPGEQRHANTETTGSITPHDQMGGSTSYALDLRIEQEGFPP